MRSILVLLYVFFASGTYRAAYGTNDKPNEGNCFELKWGGKSGLHWWACCNNCVNGVPDLTCDGFTYQTASSVSYCGSCGINTGEGTIRGSQFACGGCNGQETIRKKCTSFWKNIPGMCWAFSMCFHKKCSNHYRYKRSTSENLENCSDGVCDPGETADNCPIDCCWKKNPRCTWKNECLPECCGDSTCCLPSSTGDRTRLIGRYALALVAAVQLVIKKLLHM